MHIIKTLSSHKPSTGSILLRRTPRNHAFYELLLILSQRPFSHHPPNASGQVSPNAIKFIECGPEAFHRTLICNAK